MTDDRQANQEGLTGTTVGHIRLLELLGRGGMGEVYAGFDETLKRRVAVKAMRGDQRMTAGARERFLREAQMLSALDHPHICRIHDFVSEGESDFLVLELIDGQSLGQAIESGELEPADRFRIAAQLCAVLAEAHARGIIHRDLKPDNIMLAEQGIKVLDFGLARSLLSDDGPAAEIDLDEDQDLQPTMPQFTVGNLRTERGTVMGSPGYLSPEQARGEPLGAASDLYTLGLILQQLFTGKLPYPEGYSTMQLVWWAMRAKRQPIRGLDKDLTSLIQALTSSEPGARPAASSAATELARIRAKPRRRMIASAIAATLIALLLGAAKYTIDLQHKERAAVAARQQAERAREAEREIAEFLIGLFAVSNPSEARGNSITARELLDRGANRIEAELEDQATIQARLMATIGRVYWSLGLYQPARRLLARTLEIQEQDPGTTSVDLASTLHHLADVRRSQGDFEAAQPLFERALALRQSSELRDSTLIVHSLTSLGNVATDRGDYENAEPLFRQALELLESSETDPRSRDALTASVLNNLAALMINRGEFAEAEPLHRQALALRRQSLGPDHPEVAVSLTNLGNLYTSLERPTEAEQLFAESIAIRRASLGSDHPDLALSLNNLAAMLVRQERYQEAEPLLADALGIWQQALGPDHPDVGLAAYNLGDLYSLTDRPQQAAEYLRRALTIFEESLGGDHPYVSYPLHSLGLLLVDQPGQRPAAIEQLRRSLEIRDRTLGSDHPDSIQLRADLERIEGG